MRLAGAGLMPSHSLGTRLVASQRRAAPQLGEVVAFQAGEPGFEPGFTVLETVRIAVNSLPRGAGDSMRAEGLEPPSSFEHRHLKPACFAKFHHARAGPL